MDIKRRRTKRPQRVRSEFQLRDGERLVLIMSGGGEDGVYLLEKYISGLEYAKNDHNVKSFVNFS